MNKYIPEVQMMVEATLTGRESIRTWAQKTHEVLRSSP